MYLSRSLLCRSLFLHVVASLSGWVLGASGSLASNVQKLRFSQTSVADHGPFITQSLDRVVNTRSSTRQK